MGNKHGKGYYTRHASMRISKDRAEVAPSPSSQKSSLERHKTSWPASQGELAFCPEYTPKSQLAFEDFEVYYADIMLCVTIQIILNFL